MPPLDRRADETHRAHVALCDYAAMGPGRSLEKLVQTWAGSGPTKWLSTLKRWSADHAWQFRAQQYDEAQAAIDRAEREAIRAQRRHEVEDRDWEQGAQLRAWVADALREAPKFLRRTETAIDQNGETIRVITLALAAGPGELARAMKLASDLQRLSAGEPTEAAAITIRVVHDDDRDPSAETP
jgi:hypothetical protein